MKASFANVIEHEFTVTGLTEHSKYDFRVIARNAAGAVSKPSESTGSITAMDEIDPPKCETDPMYNQTIVINAGETFSLEACVGGKPIPTAQWFKGNVEVENSARAEIKNTDFKALLIVKDAIRVDGGQYTLVLTNVAGTKTVPFTVKADEEEWSICTPPSGVNATKFTITKLIEHQEYKVRICAINKLGVGEPTEIEGVVKPLDKLDPPEMILDAELRKGIVVRAGGSMRICIPFKGHPTPEISWAKEDGALPIKAQIDSGEDYSQLSIDICDKYDAGKYILNLENSAGTKSAFVSVKVLDTPGAPVNLTVKDVKRESVTLTWEPPLIDGGSRIKNYLVEKRESTRIVYSNVDNKCTKTSYRITGLTEGTIYYFRILAENEFGVGQQAETESSVKTSEPPLSVGKVNLTEVTKTSASFSWEKPDHDGGSRIIGYYIEMQPVGSEEWVVAATTKTCEGTVTSLSTGHEYLFRVSAFNEKGRSDPRSLAAPVTAKDVTMKPRFMLASNTYSVQNGDDLKIEIPVIGRPVPKVEWKKDGQALKETTRLNVSSALSSTKLCIKDASKEDSGKYTITATSSVGTAELEITVIILEKPGPPKGPVKIEEVSSNYVSLSWEPPEYTGGAEIEGYILEKRDMDGIRWTKCNKKRLSDLRFRCTEGGRYYFRVLAVNELGVGLPASTDQVKVAEAPLPPGKVVLIDVTRHTVSLSWEKPDHDGGSKITNFIVEMQPKGDDKWSVCSEVKALEATIGGLTTGEEYSFRVIAVNDKGKSDAKPLATPVVVKDITMLPIVNLLYDTYSVKAGDDLKVDVPFRGRPQPEVSWKKDGQALKQTTRVNVLTSKTSSKIVIKDATKEDVGKYVITLTNSVGTSTAEISVIVLDKPGPPSNIKMDEVSADFISLSWDPPTYDGGCQINNYVVEKRDTTTTSWQIVSATVARTSIKVARLIQGTEYQFRIAAENRYGKSSALDSTPVIAQYPFDSPGPPTNVHVSHATKYGMLVVWGRPSTDGGSPVIGYHIECKDQSSILWTKVNRGLLAENQFKMTDAIRRDSGQYVLTLHNVAGTRSVAINCKVLDRPGPSSGPL
uniref:Titin n=1 Tax=Cyclopterus lumpus TaxID=8103 RepID=A0A8C2ZM75_CYCLU